MKIILLVSVSCFVHAYVYDNLSPGNNFGLRKTKISIEGQSFTKIFDPLNSLNRISYRVKDGVLNFRVFVVPGNNIFPSRINGQLLFDAMWEDLLKKNVKIISIRGNWEDREERKDNLNTFNQFHNGYFDNNQIFKNIKNSKAFLDNYGQHTIGYSKMQCAALLTWSGKMASLKGFNKVEIIKANKNPFSDVFYKVEVLFYADEIELNAYLLKLLHRHMFMSS